MMRSGNGKEYARSIACCMEFPMEDGEAASLLSALSLLFWADLQGART